MIDRWFPGPLSHPLSRRLELPHRHGARRQPAGAGRRPARLPGAGRRASTRLGMHAARRRSPEAVSAPTRASTTDDLQAAGIPVPENYSAPALHGALEEDLDVHLQAIRLGDILFTVCSCEQWADQSRNIKTRTDTVAGQRVPRLRLDRQCAEPADDGSGRGHGPAPGAAPTRAPARRWTAVDDHEYRRMRAQVNNDATGWNDLDERCSRAESEPVDPAQIKGNYTHDDDARSAQLGYGLTVADRDGQRLQRLHRDLPRVPARRPLPQGADRLGPALVRLHGHAAGAARAAA